MKSNVIHFGRYNGQYTGAVYSGPNLLKKGSRSSAIAYMRKENGISYNFNVSNDIDKAVAKKFAEKFASYQKSLPKEIKDKMPNGKKELASNVRYAGSDWGVTGPNCVTFTEDTIV